MSQDLLSSLTKTKYFSLTNQDYLFYSKISHDCPFFSKISFDNEQGEYCILQFGQSLDSLLKTKKNFSILESLNIVYILGSIFEFINNSYKNGEIPVPNFSLKKINYFGGMIQTSMYLKKKKKTDEKDKNNGENKIASTYEEKGKTESKKNNNPNNQTELENKQGLFLLKLLYQLLTKEMPELTHDKKLKENEYFQKLCKQLPEFEKPILRGLLNKEKGLNEFISHIKNLAYYSSKFRMSFEKEDYTKFEDYSLEVYKFLSQMKDNVEDSLAFGSIFISVRRFIVYYILYTDKDSIKKKYMFNLLSKYAIENDKFEKFYEIYSEAAAEHDKKKQYENFLSSADQEIDKMINDMKKKCKSSNKQKNTQTELLEKFESIRLLLNANVDLMII